MPNSARFEDVQVSPFYLAGPTSDFTGDPALAPLLDLGFAVNHDDAHNVYVSSPAQDIRLGYLPEGPDHTLWKVTVHTDLFEPPRWMATFDTATPIELVTAFTTALANSHAEGPDSYLTGTALRAEEGLRPLTEAGWKHEYLRAETLLTAPDQLAGLTYSRRFLTPEAELREDAARWLLWGGRDGYISRWYASFTTHTPVRLIAATTARLADPTPVIRHPRDVPARNRGAAHITPVRPPVPTPLDVRRASAARASSTVAKHLVRAPAAPAPAGPGSRLPVRSPYRR
ncbi:DUF317 domain-containing protein [Streptomyces sp. NBC_00075]|uniref:DUF317 domain-containing protein n=1 Tax=Streptomyces sp. NBC_00075 TaxID=2975641 RepID=UPI00324E587F